MPRRDDKRLFLPAVTYLLAMLALGGIARGDEFRLKDGSKIVGTIVGFENGAFKVETDYGFAFVRNYRLAEIVPACKNASPYSPHPSPSFKPCSFRPTPPRSIPKLL